MILEPSILFLILQNVFRTRRNQFEDEELLVEVMVAHHQLRGKHKEYEK